MCTLPLDLQIRIRHWVIGMASLTLNLEPRWSRAVSFTFRSIYLRYPFKSSLIRFGLLREKSLSSARNRSPDLPELCLVAKPAGLYRLSKKYCRNVRFGTQSGNNKPKFYISVSVHHKSTIYNKTTRCNSGSIVFINNYKYALHVSDALCVHLQEHLLTYSMEQGPSWEANWFCS